MAYIGLVIDRQYAAAACGRGTAELHVTLAHIPVKTPSLEDSIPSKILLDLDLLWAYTLPQALTLGALERFDATVVRRAYGGGLALIRKKTIDLLELHGVHYSKDFEPWAPHCSIGLNYAQWSWVNYGERPAYVPHSVAVHSSRAVFAGLHGVVAHHWDLGTACRSVPPTTLADG